MRRREQSRPHRADGRRAARRAAGAVASRLPARPAHQCRRPHRPRRRSASTSCCRTIRPKRARIAAELDRLNRERQAIEIATLAQAEAEAMAALGVEEKGAVVVTAAEGWHPGVVGLVAARLKERFGRPAFAIALEPGGIGTGSGRSIPGVDLGRAVRRAVSEGLLIKGGGHAMAAGVTLRKDALGAVPRLSRGRAARRRRGGAARRCAADRRRAQRAGATVETRRHDRPRRPVRRRQSGAGHRAAGAHGGLCRGGRAGACARAAARRRRRDHQRHRVPRRRPEARRGAAGEPRARRACRRLALRSTAGRGRARTAAIAADRLAPAERRERSQLLFP